MKNEMIGNVKTDISSSFLITHVGIIITNFGWDNVFALKLNVN